MTQDLKDFLIAHNTSNGWGVSDNDLIETITEASVIHKEIYSSHRWYDDEWVIVKVGDKLIRYSGFHITGDNSRRDMDLDYDINKISEVVLKQKVVDYYEPI